MAIAVDRNVPDFRHLFAQGELAGIQAACGLSPSSPSPVNYVEKSPEPERFAAEPVVSTSNQTPELGGMASIVAGLTEKAAQAAEAFAVGQSDKPAPDAKPNYQASSVPLLAMLADAAGLNKPIVDTYQGQHCSPEDLGALASQSVGTSQRGQSTGHSVA